MKLRVVGWVAVVCAAGAVSVEAGIPVVASYTSYRYGKGHDSCWVECAYSVSRDSLQFTYVPEDSIWQASFRVDLVLFDSLGQPVDSSTRNVGTRAPSLEESHRRDVKVLDIMPFLMSPGRYVAQFTVSDLADSSRGTRLDTIVVENKNHDSELTLSDLALAYRLTPTDAPADPAHPKIKNGYYVEPNPSGIFAPEDSMLYLYGEIYNLKPAPALYQVHLWILDPFGEVVRDLGIEQLEPPGETALLAYGLRINDLPRGIWHTVAVEVDHGLSTATMRKPFWLGTGEITDSARAVQPFDENDAMLNRRFIVYLATSDELAEYDALSLEGKRRFLDDFWMKRDPDINTTKNEFFEAHRMRFAIANQKFSRSFSNKEDGWNTDRGRILILYGEPDEVVQTPSSIATWGYERWEYRQLEGGVYFIFLDWKNLGDYRLMHSNKQGERWDPDWQSKIEAEGLDPLSR